MDASFLWDLAPLLGQALDVRDCCASGRCWPGCLGRCLGKEELSRPLVALAPVASEMLVHVIVLRQAGQNGQDGRAAVEAEWASSGGGGPASGSRGGGIVGSSGR